MSYEEEVFDRDEKMDAKIWKRLFGYAIRKHGLFWKVVLFMLITAVVDDIYPVLTKFAIDRFVRPESVPTTEGIW